MTIIAISTVALLLAGLHYHVRRHNERLAERDAEMLRAYIRKQLEAL